MTEDNNPSTQNKAAIALEYDGENTPLVTATGQNDVADQIIALALEHDVPLYENAELAKQLADVDLGKEIPEKLFLAIAHIIAFAYHLQGKLPKDWDEKERSNGEKEKSPGTGLVPDPGNLILDDEDPDEFK